MRRDRSRDGLSPRPIPKHLVWQKRFLPGGSTCHRGSIYAIGACGGGEFFACGRVEIPLVSCRIPSRNAHFIPLPLRGDAVQDQGGQLGRFRKARPPPGSLRTPVQNQEKNCSGAPGWNSRQSSSARGTRMRWWTLRRVERLILAQQWEIYFHNAAVFSSQTSRIDLRVRILRLSAYRYHPRREINAAAGVSGPIRRIRCRHKTISWGTFMEHFTTR